MRITSDLLAQYQPNTVRALGFPRASLFFLQIVDPRLFCAGLTRLRRADLFENGRPPRTARATLALSAGGLRALGVPSALIGCLGDAFNQGMAARSEHLRDRATNAPDCWQYPFGTGLIHVLLALHVPQPDLRPEAVLAGALNRTEDEAATLFRQHLGARLLHVERGQRRYLGKGPEQAPVNTLSFVDGLSQPVRHDDAALLDDFVLRPPAEGHRRPPPLKAPWSDILEHASQHQPDLQRRYAALARALTEASHLMVYRKIGISPRTFAAAAETLGNATGMDRRRAQEQMIGRRRNGMPLGTRQGGGMRRLRKHNNFDFLNDPDGKVHPRGSHIRRSNPRRDRNDEVGLAHQGQNIRRGPDGLSVGGHNMLRRGISFRDYAHDPAEGLHFMALVRDLERQFEFVQREWLNKGDFFGQPSEFVDPVAATSRTHTKVQLSDEHPVVELKIPSRLHGGEYFLVPGQRLLRHLGGRAGAEPLPELTADPLAIFSTSAARNPEKQLEPVARLSLTRRRVVPLGDGFAVARWADCLHVLQQHDAYSSGHYLKRIRELTGKADFALGMAAGPAHSAQRQDIEALLHDPRRSVRTEDPITLAEDRTVDLLEAVIWPRLVDLAETLFAITVPEEATPIAIGDKLGDVTAGRYRNNYRADLERFFRLEPARPEDRTAIKVMNLSCAVRRMGIYVIGFSESETFRRRALEGAETFRTWLKGGPGALNEAIAQGLAVAACGTLEKAAALVLDRIIRDPVAAAALRSGPNGELADDTMLRAIILEALRLAPVLPVFERDTVRQVDLAGTTIPKGRRVTVLAAGALRDWRRFGDDADRFNPVRARPADGTMLFGYGKHLCSGDETAQRFLVSLLRDLFSRYDLLPAAGADAGLEYANAISNQPIALNVRVRRR